MCTDYICDNEIFLHDSLFLGQGIHKAVYVHPFNPGLCIKIPFSLPDSDIDRELKYRLILQSRPAKNLLTNYYGQVKTNKGIGLIFDNVCDYDDYSSASFLEWLLEPQELCKTLEANPLQIFKKFRNDFLQQNIVVSDTDPVNILIQRTSATSWQFKIIDNIGTPVLIPLAYYFEIFAALRARRYWKRFVLRCKKLNPQLLSDTEWQSLL